MKPARVTLRLPNRLARGQMLEYFFTKERVTLENQAAGEDSSVPFAKQFKAIFSDKYMLLIYVYFLVYSPPSPGPHSPPRPASR